MQTPLYTALRALNAENQLSFHMPGHLGPIGMEGFDGLLGLDTTEVPESDNLFHASGVIAEAEARAAEFFRVKKTRFLVNGSSGGILAMVGAVINEGDKIICDRFCHRSFISALIFSGAKPVWLRSEELDGGLIWGGIDPADVESAIAANSDAKAVYITSPNYFGLCCDVESIAEIAHRHGLPMLVDSAHGAHFGVSPMLPPAAANLGADMAVVSAHKTLPSLTQSAYLHINGDFPRLESMLKMHQTSSPSYILMASLDHARAKTQAEGNERWSALAGEISDIFPEQAHVPGKHVKYKDITRLVFPLNTNPFEAAEALRQKYGISVECAYGGGLVCIANTAHTRDDLLRLKCALADMPTTDFVPMPFTPLPSEAVLTPREAFFRDVEEVPISSAAGRICAREVLVYPPGVAQIMPGEIITAEMARAIETVAACGGEVHGINNGKITVTV